MKHSLYKKIGLIWIVFLVIITITFLFIDLPAAKPGDLEGFITYLDTKMPEYMEKHNVAGAAVGLIHDGKIVYLQGYGFADRQRSIPVSDHTVFQAASISKTMTAWGIMNLVEEGKLELDAPVSQYLTRWELPQSNFDPNGVTIRRLLSHTAGIANVGGYTGFGPEEIPQTLEESLTSAEDANGEGVRIVRQPGAKYAYSGGGYSLLQLVIEEVTHMPFEEFMKSELLTPLAMNQSGFVLDPEMAANLSLVYDGNGNARPSKVFTAKAAAGLYTTAQDLSTWVATMIPSEMPSQGGNVLAPETLHEMFLSQTGQKGLSSYGLGYMVQSIFSTDENEIYHTGTNVPGWCSVIATVPEKGEGLVVLTNSAGGAAIRHEIHSAWLFWVTGSSTLALRVQKLVNILMYILPVGVAGGVALLIASIISRKRGNASSGS